MEKMMTATGAKRLWIAAFLFIQREWQWIWSQMRAFTCLTCFTHLCVYVCDLSTVSDCLFSLCRTSPPVYLQTETMATCQPWYVLLTPICHHQSSTASSLHLERKRDGNQRRRTWQWGFQQKALHQPNGASCVIKNTKLPSVTGCKWSALVKTRC